MQEATCWAHSELLPVLETFHSLRFKEREIGDLTLREVHTQELLQDLLEPRGALGSGVDRSAVHLAVRRRGWLLTEAAALAIHVCDLSLREITVESHSPLRPISDVQIGVEIAGVSDSQWFGFVGTLSPDFDGAGRATICLDHPLDPQSLLGGVWPMPTDRRGRALIAVDDPQLSSELARMVQAIGFDSRVVRHALPVTQWLGKALLTLDGERLQHLTFPEVIITDGVIGGRAGLELASGLQLLNLPTLLVALRGFADSHLAQIAASMGSLQVFVPDSRPSQVGISVVSQIGQFQRMTDTARC